MGSRFRPRVALAPLLVRGGPGPGQKLVEAIVRPEIDETGKHVGDVGLAVDAIQFASLDQRSEHGPVRLRRVMIPPRVVLSSYLDQ